MSIELVFKSWEDSFHMGKLHPKMRPILTYVINHAWTRYGIRLVVTSIYREDGGVHQYFRGADLVPEDRAVEAMEKIREDTNKEWDYGKAGIQVIPPVRHGTAPHLHLQARDATERRTHDA